MPILGSKEQGGGRELEWRQTWVQRPLCSVQVRTSDFPKHSLGLAGHVPVSVPKSLCITTATSDNGNTANNACNHTQRVTSIYHGDHMGSPAWTFKMIARSFRRLRKFFGQRRRRRSKGKPATSVSNRVFASRLDITAATEKPGELGKQLGSAAHALSYTPKGPARARWSQVHKLFGPGAQASLLIPNAGGKSSRSEALSISVMEHFFHASGVLAEMEVQYCGYAWSMVDYICTIQKHRIGVSVFRAMVGPTMRRNDFSEEEAERLVEKKLKGLIVARNCVSRQHRFHKCILHCIAQSPTAGRMMVRALRQAQEYFEPELIALVTVVRHSDCIFYEPAAASETE